MSSSEHGQESYQSQSLAETFGTCINEYSQLLFALADENCQAVKLKQISIEKVLDGYGRLKVWGEQNRATLPASTRGSLDDVLRHDDGLNRNVVQILNRLIHQIEAALPIASQKIGDTFGLETKSKSGSDSGSDSEYSSGSSEDSHASTERLTTKQRPPKITFLMAHIQEQIKLLYHFDALLRRPRLSGRYLKSTNENRQVSLIEKYDYAHVEEKHRQWVTSFKSSENESESEGQPENIPSQSPRAQAYKTWEDEPIVSQDVLQSRENGQKKDDSHNIISRLARANTRRREQLRYWERHPFSKDIEESASVTNKEPGIPLRGVDLSRDMGLETPISLTSVPTVQSFSTVAKSVIDETKTISGRPRTVYTASVVGGRQSARVPDIPKAAFEEDQVECPFCHVMLDSATIQSRMSWKRHVFRDLRPYTCTYDDCPNPDKMYATRHDWIYHEMQMHRRQWKCQKCHVGFHNKISMADHLKKSHTESATSQLAIFLEMSERPLDDDYRMECVLCTSQLALSRLLDHLAQHMEEIALFVLPSLSDEDEDANSNAARLSRDQDWNTPEANTKTPDSSLGFSDIDWAERPRQDAQVFTRLIKSPRYEVRDKPDHSDDAGSTKLDKFYQFEQLVKDFEAEVEQKINVLGKEDSETLETMRRLTVAYQEVGEYEAAKAASVQFIEGCKKVFGETDSMTMEGFVQLAFSHRRLKNLDEAERLMLEVVEIDKKERGEQHRETLKNQRDLSKVYIEAARWDDAEETLTKTAEVMAEVLGENHKDTLEAQSDLALTYANQGRLEDAEKLGNWTLQQVRLNIPENYKVWLRALDSMARIYWAQGRKEEACAIYREAIDWMIRWHGLNSPLTLEAIEDLKELENQM
ncbi:uncharacterized protein B0J16DRAFT_348844 [Fusarium flagelliforme]|uniref:C2h2 type zinc finger domain protein n=1 Tax=Fusarium flagelliforme TaxID=2675880 RepID=A0A395MKJ4_9HYPO|nr:uncharacterized protein B0J16DRAFT_348844 [Fusarium flagelliforme]KAH7174588.1 hypothetical protein B0J16DRAFT_348844 [Fusarium flagelliforme]RFN48377.1 c2h2 type zinc finger domain protein [Fusarium flagelliforme]